MGGEIEFARSAAAAVLLVFATGCGRSAEPTEGSWTGMQVPASWSPVITPSDGEWTGVELEVMNAALHLLESTLPSDDPRRGLLRSATYVPLDRWSDVDGPPPEGVEAVFSVRTERVYVARPDPAGALPLAATLAHELHHMQRDRTESVNRMQEVDRERRAHAREAEDAGRMLAALRESAADPPSLAPLELAQAKARALAAMYSAKLELFRLVQEMDRVEGLRGMPELFRLYRECMEVAASALSTDHSRDLRLLEALSSASGVTDAAAALSAPIDRARQAIRECQPLMSRVEELRSRSGMR